MEISLLNYSHECLALSCIGSKETDVFSLLLLLSQHVASMCKAYNKDNFTCSSCCHVLSPSHRQPPIWILPDESEKKKTKISALLEFFHFDTITIISSYVFVDGCLAAAFAAFFFLPACQKGLLHVRKHESEIKAFQKERGVILNQTKCTNLSCCTSLDRVMLQCLCFAWNLVDSCRSPVGNLTGCWGRILFFESHCEHNVIVLLQLLCF